MQAFHNDPLIKKKYIARVRKHIKLDELVKGATGQDGKGCAVWCTLDKYDHKAYETELGVPEWLARCEDTFFENLPTREANKWPLKFLQAVNLGSDLNKIKTPFIVYILNENLKTLNSLKVDAKFKDVIAAIEQTKLATQQMIKAQKSGKGLESAESAA
jgi:hypothetical protein